MPVESRRKVKAFAGEMERILKKNDWRDGWESMTMAEIVTELDEEIGELKKAVGLLSILEGSPHLVEVVGSRPAMVKIHVALREECVDVANVCMMMADNFGHLDAIYAPGDE